MISYWDFQDHGMQAVMRTPLYFAGQGHEVTFMVHSETTANPTLIENLHSNARILRYDLPAKWFGKIPMVQRVRQFLLFAFFCVIHALKIYRGGNKPKVIYAAECDAVLIGCFLRWIYKVPLVTRFYGVARITAHFDSERKRLNCAGLRHIGTRLALTRKAEMIIITDDGSNGLQLVRAINPHVEKVKFWRNGIDERLVSSRDVARLRKSHEICPDDFVLLTVCRLDPMKKVDRAIRALHYLQEAGLTNSKLVVVGHGIERQVLERLVSELDLRQSVVFVGAVEHNRIYEYYALADVFLSLYDLTNVGNPLLEALNSGKCIVTLNTGRTGEVIRDGMNGRLLEVGDDENDLARRLGEVLVELHKSQGLRSSLAEGARLYGQEFLWTWDERLKAELNSILELIED